MVRYVVEASKVIDGPADFVYNIIKDYHDGHPHMMPPDFFESMKVLRGTGVGEGTRIEANFKFYGQRSTLILDVSEPKPGRILQEIDTNAKNITHFIVDKLDDDDDDETCRVTFRTAVLKSLGVFAALDMWVTRKAMNIMYEAELKQLNKLVQERWQQKK